MFHDDDDVDDVEKQRLDYDLDFARLADVKETVIDDNASDEELDNSGVRMRLKNKKKQPTRRRKQVQLCSSVVPFTIRINSIRLLKLSESFRFTFNLKSRKFEMVSSHKQALIFL